MPDLNPGLQRSRRVRSERAAIKSALGAREIYLDDVLEALYVRRCLETATLVEIVAAARGFSKGKATKALSRLGIPSHRKLEDASQRDRRQLVLHLQERHPQAFWGAAWREYV